MRAFQLKIAIKNSKPPIWRRVVVPSGITFSQLSMILNEVMGWSGSHLFSFEFYHKELCVIEGAEEPELLGRYDNLEASTTLIREFMEENDWFTYTYDFGDDWQHRVTIEKTLEDWEYDYPQVLKYKGDCPIEDCGGIEGYYDCLKVIENEAHPEYKEQLAWMKSQGYPQEYDMNDVNEKLKSTYFYRIGKCETRRQRALYEAQWKGECGLCAAKNDKNKKLNVIRSDRHRVDDLLKQIADMMKPYTGMTEPEHRYWTKPDTLKDIFQDYEKSDLLDMAGEKGVSGIFGQEKQQIIEKLYVFMMKEEEIKKYFYCMNAAARREFEKASNAEGLYTSGDMGALTKLYQGGYIGVLEDGSILIPKDVKEAYRKYVDRAFEQECDRRCYVLSCLAVSKYLYGIVPMDVFSELVNTWDGNKLSEMEIRQIIKEIPVEYMEFMLKNNKLYHKALYPNDRGLAYAQGDKAYYVPTKEEIMDIGENGYLSNDPHMKRFQKYMKNKLDALEDEAEFGGRIIWGMICSDREMQSIFGVLEDLGLMVDTEKEVQALVREISQLWNNTRSLLNRGYTPNEMQRQKRADRKAPVNNVVKFEEARKNKIYPNDPCPCGSGRKYKNCCRNKERG